MRLLFFRHAEAGYDAPSDFERTLTARGIKRTQTAAQVIKRLGIMPRAIYSSPRIRARETADIIADVLGVRVQIHDGLDFNFEVDVVRELTALGTWSGEAKEFSLDLAAARAEGRGGCAVIVQQGRGGPIIGAAVMDLDSADG